MKNSNKKKLTHPALRFSPTAWAKLIFMRDMTDNEVGAFGITGADDLLFVTDIAAVKQKVTGVSIAFEDESIADFFENQVDAGRTPEQFARVWIHTHPGSSPEPSGTDEQTFERVFGSCEWAVMFVIARDGNTYARLRFNVGPGGEVKIPVCVDYSIEFNAADFELWKKEYDQNVMEDHRFGFGKPVKSSDTELGLEEESIFGSTFENYGEYYSGEDLLEEIDRMDPAERQAFMDELAVHSDFWDEEQEVSL